MWFSLQKLRSTYCKGISFGTFGFQVWKCSKIFNTESTVHPRLGFISSHVRPRGVNGPRGGPVHQHTATGQIKQCDNRSVIHILIRHMPTTQLLLSPWPCSTLSLLLTLYQPSRYLRSPLADLYQTGKA